MTVGSEVRQLCPANRRKPQLASICREHNLMALMAFYPSCHLTSTCILCRFMMEFHAFQDPFVYSDADVVFRSSDGMNFKAPRIVLSLASASFQDMFRLPQSTPSTSRPAGLSIDSSLRCPSPYRSDSVDADGLPIVQCTETGTVLDNLFRLSYPIRDPTFSGIGDICATLEADMKLDMPQATYILRRELNSCIPTTPLRVYAIACLLEIQEDAQSAAAEVLKKNARDTYVDEMEEITAGAYQRLLNYSHPTFFVRHLVFNPFTPLARTVLTVTTSTEANTPTQHAPHPFCADDADVTLLSSDNVEFAVSSAFVRFSSSTLDSMLTKVTTPSSEYSIGHRPFLSLPEPAKILSIVLGFCYLGDDPALSSYDDAYSALAAAVKYSIQQAIRFLVAAIPALCDDPVKLYFIACMYDLRDLAVGAAQRAVGQELNNLNIPRWIPDASPLAIYTVFSTTDADCSLPNAVLPARACGYRETGASWFRTDATRRRHTLPKGPMRAGSTRTCRGSCFCHGRLRRL